jgi:thioredoxin 1
MAIDVNDSNFEEVVIKSEKPVVVDFWAEWCGPCRMIAPTIEDMAREFSDKAVVAKCNVDDSPQVAIKYSIRSIPTILFFKEGKIADKQVGAVPKNVLADKLKSLL